MEPLSDFSPPPLEPIGISPFGEKPITWEGVALLFDGEGTVTAYVAPRGLVVKPRLTIALKPRQPLERVAQFLKTQGIESRIHLVVVHHLDVARKDDMIKMAKQMIPHSIVKKRQLEALVDYIEDKITGDEFLSILMEEYEKGYRRLPPPIPPYSIPYTHSEGISLRARISGLYSAIARGFDAELRERLSELETIYLKPSPIKSPHNPQIIPAEVEAISTKYQDLREPIFIADYEAAIYIAEELRRELEGLGLFTPRVRLVWGDMMAALRAMDWWRAGEHYTLLGFAIKEALEEAKVAAHRLPRVLSRF